MRHDGDGRAQKFEAHGNAARGVPLGDRRTEPARERVLFKRDEPPPRKRGEHLFVEGRNGAAVDDLRIAAAFHAPRFQRAAHGARAAGEHHGSLPFREHLPKALRNGRRSPQRGRFAVRVTEHGGRVQCARISEELRKFRAVLGREDAQIRHGAQRRKVV